MYTELRRYTKNEFCKNIGCEHFKPSFETDELKCQAVGCIKTAKDFHHWLNENKFHLLKPTA